MESRFFLTHEKWFARMYRCNMGVLHTLRRSRAPYWNNGQTKGEIIMKQLQNNFTTPEQSKWLLELGVPVDSADCFYLKVPPVEDYVYVLTDNRTYTEQATLSEYKYSDFIPCWSVGRLIEIYHICDQPGCTFSFNICFPNLVSEMIHEISLAKERRWIDFSKLEK